jgi:hypothetical protein
MAWFLKLVKTDEDPNVWGGSKYLRRITVDKRHFDSWLRNATKPRAGPPRKATGYAVADRKLFPAIAELLESGEALSVRDAVLKLFDDNKIKGASRESAAKRVASRYLREVGR